MQIDEIVIFDKKHEIVQIVRFRNFYRGKMYKNVNFK